MMVIMLTRKVITAIIVKKKDIHDDVVDDKDMTAIASIIMIAFLTNPTFVLPYLSLFFHSLPVLLLNIFLNSVVARSGSL